MVKTLTKNDALEQDGHAPRLVISWADGISGVCSKLVFTTEQTAGLFSTTLLPHFRIHIEMKRQHSTARCSWKQKNSVRVPNPLIDLIE
mmetsp:Transcript_27083/g.105409  ORF Transcript_27083/g.105409 Transcript_27083/m.105409 type:complete len:89 (-) Transcript_27083:1325-1591(-)